MVFLIVSSLASSLISKLATTPFVMKIIRTFTLVSATVLTSLALSADPASTEPVPPLPAPRPRVSPHETISNVIGDRRTGNRITITYGRPYTKDPKTGSPRKIWGSLVAWDKADRLGADEATLLITQQALVIGDTTIPAGAYTLYIIPSETGTAKLAFSNSLGKWGIPVDETKDVARVPLTKATLASPVDQLTIGIENDAAAAGGVIKIQWETTQFALPFTVKK